MSIEIENFKINCAKGKHEVKLHCHDHAQLLGISNTQFRAIITSRKISDWCFAYVVGRGRRRGSQKEKPVNTADCWGGIKLNNW